MIINLHNHLCIGIAMKESNDCGSAYPVTDNELNEIFICFTNELI